MLLTTNELFQTENNFIYMQLQQFYTVTELEKNFTSIIVFLLNRCITVRYTAPVDCLFWRRGRLHQLGRRLVDLIADMSLEEHPIFFHVFSNGGASLYQHVSLAIQMREKPLKVLTLLM